MAAKTCKALDAVHTGESTQCLNVYALVVSAFQGQDALAAE